MILQLSMACCCRELAGGEYCCGTLRPTRDMLSSLTGGTTVWSHEDSGTTAGRAGGTGRWGGGGSVDSPSTGGAVSEVLVAVDSSTTISG